MADDTSDAPPQTQDLQNALTQGTNLKILPDLTFVEDDGPPVTCTVTVTGLTSDMLAIMKSIAGGVNNKVWTYQYSKTINPPPPPPNSDGTPGTPGTTFQVVFTTVIKIPTPQDVKKYITNDILNMTNVMGGSITKSSAVTDQYSYWWYFTTNTPATSPDAGVVLKTITNLMGAVNGDVTSHYAGFGWSFTNAVATIDLPDYPNTLNYNITFAKK